jgi:hypothetical protein
MVRLSSNKYTTTVFLEVLWGSRDSVIETAGGEMALAYVNEILCDLAIVSGLEDYAMPGNHLPTFRELSSLFPKQPKWISYTLNQDQKLTRVERSTKTVDCPKIRQT